MSEYVIRGINGAVLAKGSNIRDAISSRGAYLRGAYLHGADLCGADLCGAYLCGAYLCGAYLCGAYLCGAYLHGAYLHGSYLRYADLRYADLRDANLRDANLRDANLRGADLRGADLRYADLRGADLRGADLRDAKIMSPTMILLAQWHDVPDDLCIELMRYDAANHPDPSLFDIWAGDACKCPYEDCRFERAANFTERANLWSPGPAKTALELATALLDLYCNPENKKDEAK